MVLQHSQPLLRILNLKHTTIRVFPEVEEYLTEMNLESYDDLSAFMRDVSRDVIETLLDECQ